MRTFNNSASSQEHPNVIGNEEEEGGGVSTTIRRRRRLLLMGIGVLAVMFGMCSDYGFITRLQLERRQGELNDSLQSSLKQIDSLSKDVYRLQYDTVQIERLAREKYGLSRPGEQVYIVKKSKQ